jgi:hypothetical protein
MSLRKSPQISPQSLDTARSNARRSNGPRSAAGKQHSRMNALKHGERSDPENHYAVMRALGEDPAQFEAMKQELRESFGPGDAFFEKQLDDLARFYWRRDRLERSQTGLMRRALLAVEDAQHRRRKEIEGATFDSLQAINIEMPLPADPGARLRLLLSFLGVIREQVRSGSFQAWQATELEYLYEKQPGWRPARLCHLLSLFAESASRVPQEDETVAQTCFARSAAGSDEPPAPAAAPGEEADEAQYKELLQLLEEEMAGVQEEFEYEEKLNQERAAIERDACLAPAGEQWKLMLRREETLDRSIDRKIKLLLTLRKGAAPPPVETTALSPRESVSRSGAFISRSATGEGSLDDPEAARPTPAEEGDRPAVARDEKINERSGNVEENKGQVIPAADRRQDDAPAEQRVRATEVEVAAV